MAEFYSSNEKAGLGEEVAKVFTLSIAATNDDIYITKQQPAKIVIDKIKYNKYTTYNSNNTVIIIQ